MAMGRHISLEGNNKEISLFHQAFDSGNDSSKPISNFS